MTSRRPAPSPTRSGPPSRGSPVVHRPSTTPNALLSGSARPGRFSSTTDTDYLDARVSNAGGNKIDAFLSRTITYDVRTTRARAPFDATARIELHNAPPPTGCPTT